MTDRLEKLEREFEEAKSLSARLDSLRHSQEQYFSNRKNLVETIEELKNRFMAHLDEEQRFLESLPGTMAACINREKEVLKLRKEMLEIINSAK